VYLRRCGGDKEKIGKYTEGVEERWKAAGIEGMIERLEGRRSRTGGLGKYNGWHTTGSSRGSKGGRTCIGIQQTGGTGEVLL
jgi:hypothetical protein